MIKIRMLKSSSADFDAQVTALAPPGQQPDGDLVKTVAAILEQVRQRGDVALLEYTNRFDNRSADLKDLEIDRNSLESFTGRIPKDLLQALQQAASRIESYHERQKLESWTYEDETGVVLGQQVTPLDRAGVYVPGGRAAYPSSVLMNVIPAKVAGVNEIIMVVPAPGDELNPVVLAAASIAGVDRIFTVGGAQAVGALAFGTETIPAVDKIVGPGNRYVAEAKRQVFGIVGIDMIAGPSEVVIVSDGSSEPDWVAMDLFAQAEHDEDARSILVCTEEDFVEKVIESINRLLPQQERSEIIQKSLEHQGCIILVENLDQAAAVVNFLAPEHLELALTDTNGMLAGIRHAGAIFLGHYAAEVLGDYCAGPNHVLPTAGTARFSSPLGVYDFQKRSSLIQCDAASASVLAKTASVLARGEGLTSHARSAEYRITQRKSE